MNRDEILALAERVLKSEDRAQEWLARPSPFLDMRPAAELLDSQTGRDQVEQLLLQAEGGFAV